MADTGFFKGWLGPFMLTRRYASRKPEPGDDELGRIYEAYNVFTDNPALVLIPSEHAPMEPQEEWRVRLRCQVRPPYVVLEVEQAPSSGRLSQLRGMLELLGTAIERLASGEEARAHLTCLPMRPLEYLMYGVRRAYGWVRAKRWRTLAVCGLVLLSLRVFIHFYVTERVTYVPYAGNEALVHGAAGSHAPTLANKATVDQEPLAYPLPAKPFIDQAKAPCKPNEDEVEINGGCWVELARRPPCRENQAEYGGKCYLPISASSRSKRESQSIHR